MLRLRIFLVIYLNFAAEPVDILFIVFDNGESLQLLQSIDLLQSLSGRKILVLALGDPANTVFKGKQYLTTLSDLGIPADEAHPPNGKTDPSRSQLLSPAALAKLTEAWPSVRVTVPGFAYRMQAQIATAWPSAVVECAMDGWGLWNDEKWLAAKYFMDNSVCTEVLVPTFAQSRSLLQRHPSTLISVVGNPSMEEWRLAAGDVGLVQRVHDSLYGSSPGVLLVGGYGEGHENDLETFCNTSKKVPEMSFAYAPHPGAVDGLDMDREFFKRHDCEGVIVTLDRKLVLHDDSQVKINTMLASAASQATTSRYSTAGGQSLYLGVPHAYIDGPHPSHQNVFSDLIPVVRTAGDLAEWIRDQGSKRFDPKILGTIVPYLGGDSAPRLAHSLLGAVNWSLDRPNPSVDPSQPNCFKDNILSAVLGSIIGILLVCFALFTRQRYTPRLEALMGDNVELGDSARTTIQKRRCT